MILTRSKHPSNTCECKSCVYKRKDIDYGSRIDKLYHNKYLPLRENKLIEKLIRTRSVYDDIRERILSLSSVDIAKERDIEGTEESESDSGSSASQLLELVDLIDRGVYPPLKSPVHLHSDCCGCCICSSKSRIHKKYKVHMHIPAKEDIDRYVESHSKMRKNVVKVGFKGARSDPCLCALKFSKIPRKPKYIPKKRRSKGSVTDKSKKKEKKPPKVTCECRKDAAEDTTSNKSYALLRNAENRVRTSIRSTVTKIENAFHIKKDSLMIFREQLKKKEELKIWQCDPDYCTPDECNPEECFEKIKRRAAKKMSQDEYDYYFSTGQKKYKVKQTQHHQEKQLPFPRECDPYMCIPGECDPRECAKILLKSSPAGHELVRCFCTEESKEPRPAKPQKPKKEKQKKKPKVKNKSSTTMKKSKTIICKCDVSENISTQTKKDTKSKPPIAVKRKPHALLPYECEPSFCVPGECNPLICEERIKQRNKVMPTDTHSLQIPQKHIMPKQRKSSKRKETKPIADKTNSSPNEPRKQAVRISSSFKFDIEFFKEKNFPEGLDNTEVRHKIKPVKKEYKEPMNRSVSEVILQRKEEQKYESQTQNAPTIDEQVSRDTFLKRCFCTLKLQKTPKQKPIPKRPKSKMTMTTKRKKESIEKAMCQCKPDLLPYECEPYFCVPGKCDPVVCEKQIQIRNLKKPKTKSKEINTEPKKSTKTITSKSVAPYIETIQEPKRKKLKPDVEQHRKPQADLTNSAPNAPRKQAVRISSSFRFDIEFYKNNSLKNEETLSIASSNKEKPKHKSVSVDNQPRQIVQESTSQTSERIKPTVVSAEPLERCFCTLKLKKEPKQKVEKKPKEVKIEAVCKCKTKDMSTQTKKVSKNVKQKVFVEPPIPQSGLLPYECEPNFCVPGECEPLICAERIKVRNKKEIDKEPLLKRCFCTLKFHSDNTKKNRTVSPVPLENNLEVMSVKSIGTDTKKIKIRQKKGSHKLHQAKYANTENPKIKCKCEYSETEYVSKEKSQNTQQDTKEEYASEKENLSSNATPVKSRQSIKLSSEFSFDIEFSKNISLKNVVKKIRKVKPKIGVKLTKSIKGHRNSVTQGKTVQTKDSLTTDKKLERCFCTLKLQKKGNQYLSKSSPKHQQIYFVTHTKKVSTKFLREYNVSPCGSKPCLCCSGTKNL